MSSRLFFLVAAVVCVCLPTSAQVQPAAPIPSPLAVIDLVVEPAIPVNDATNVVVSPDQRHVYVVMRPSGTSAGLAVVNAATHVVESILNLGEGIPFDLAVSPDGTRVYVAISKISGSTVLAINSRLAVVDVSTSSPQVVAEIEATLANGTLATALTGVAVHPSLPLVYVCDRSLDRVFVIDTTTNTVVAAIPVAGGTLGSRGSVALTVTPDGTRLYVANRGIPSPSPAPQPLRFAEVDLSTNAVTMIPSDLAASGSLVMVAMSPDGRRLYSTSQAATDSRISVIDTDPSSTTYRSESFIATPAVSPLRGLALTADGRHLFATYPAAGTMMIVDTVENTVIREINVGSDPLRVTARDARGSRAFVATSIGLVPLALPAPVVGAAAALGDEAHPISLTGTVSDLDSPNLTTSWTYAAVDNPSATCAFASPDSPVTTITCSDSGAFTATLTADDVDNEPVHTTIAVTIHNRAPHATFSAPGSVTESAAFVLSLTDAADVSSVDAAAGFTYAFDCGDGFGAFGPLPTVSCTAPAYSVGSPAMTVKAAVRDKDGGSSEYAATVAVTVKDVSTPGEMRGNGFIRNDQAKYSFEFHAREQARGHERATIKIRIDDDGRQRRRGGHSRDDRFESRTVDFIAFSNDPTIRPGRSRRHQVDTVLFAGVGEWNGQRNYRYEAFAQDAHESGRHRGSMRVKIFSPSGALVAQFEGDLDGGDIRSMRIRH